MTYRECANKYGGSMKTLYDAMIDEKLDPKDAAEVWEKSAGNEFIDYSFTFRMDVPPEIIVERCRKVNEEVANHIKSRYELRMSGMEGGGAMKKQKATI